MSTKYAIMEPQQSRMGGWFGKVFTEDQQTILFETLQPSKRMAFVECALWVIELNKTTSLIQEEKKPNV